MKFQTFTIIIKKDDPSGWYVSVKELPGCFSCGDTPEAARHNILDAIQLYLETDPSKSRSAKSRTSFIEEVNIPISKELEHA